jgi:hypothetical protein
MDRGLSSRACSLVVLSVLACGVAQGWTQPVFGGLSSASSFIYDFSILLQNVGSAKVTVINAFTVDGVDISRPLVRIRLLTQCRLVMRYRAAGQ